MESIKLPPRSYFSTETSPGFRASTIQTWSQSRPQPNPHNASEQSRKSSAYSMSSESQSIMVFTDMEELMSPLSRQNSIQELPEQVTKTGTRKSESKFTLFPPGARGPPSLGSLTQQPLKQASRPQNKRYSNDARDGQDFAFLEEPYEALPPDNTTAFARDLVAVNNASNNTRGLVAAYEEFPRPPGRSFYHPKRLLRFTGLFPEKRNVDIRHRPLANIDKRLPQPPYHVFDIKRKGWLVVLLSLIGLLAPLSASIYFPAVLTIGKELKISNAVALLTVTVHIAIHGVAPFLSNPLSESFGRRPVLIGALSLFVGANVGLVFVRSVAGFFVLRGLQAAGAAPLPMIAAVMIGDVSSGAEMEQLLAMFGTFLMFSLLISPVIGGIFTQMAGFRTIFWFLGVFGASILVIVLVVLPETHRGIAGNGTIRLPKIRRPLWSIFRPSFYAAFTTNMGASPPTFRLTAVISPLRSLSQLDILPSLLVGGVAFAVLATVISTTALLFQSRYGLSPLFAGIVYLPSTLGAILGFFLMIYRLRSDYEIIEARFKTTHGIEAHISMQSFPVAGFPIERARLRSAWWIMLIFIGTTVGYGFALDARSIVRPLVFQFFVAGNATAILMINKVMIEDLHPGKSSTLVVNFVRFGMGGLFIGVVQLLINRLGTGVTFSILAGVMLGLCPILVLQWIYSGKSRSKRRISPGKVTPGSGLV